MNPQLQPHGTMAAACEMTENAIMYGVYSSKSFLGPILCGWLLTFALAFRCFRNSAACMCESVFLSLTHLVYLLFYFLLCTVSSMDNVSIPDKLLTASTTSLSGCRISRHTLSFSFAHVPALVPLDSVSPVSLYLACYANGESIRMYIYIFIVLMVVVRPFFFFNLDSQLPHVLPP